MKNITVMICVGARPNFMKAAPLLERLKGDRTMSPFLLHTGQHYDEGMNDAFFRDLRLPRPHAYLGVGSGSHARQTALIMMRCEKIILRRRPDIVLVVGDVNSTLACSLAAVKMGIPVGHVEAGLRSGDMTMPEEINRLLTDRISELLFTTSRDADDNLKHEGIPAGKIFFVGNVMIDTLLRHRELAEISGGLRALGVDTNRPYALLTLHRPSNVDTRQTLNRILGALREIAGRISIFFPAHPRTAKKIGEFGLKKHFSPGTGIHLLPPLGYLDFLRLMTHSSFVLTDSGGIQEETTVLGIPCLTLRENTERPVTVTQGTNTVVGTDPDAIVKEAVRILSGKGKRGRVPKLWDGRAAARIVRILKRYFARGTSRARRIRSF